MRSKAVRFLGVVVVLSLLFRLGGLVLTRLLGEGDEDTDEFRVVVLWGGRQFRSRAGSLKRGSLLAVMGGAQLDFTAATPQTGGADVEVQTLLGGVEVIVPASWRLDVDSDLAAGAVEIRRVQEDDLAADAPWLRLRAVPRLGGIAVRDGG